MTASVFALLRPHQWVKNSFIFLPMFFGGMIGNAWCWGQALLAFIAFTFASSAVYCFNDILDADNDRLHPEKKNRPVASGDVSKSIAYLICFICLTLSLLTCLFFPHSTFWIELGIIFVYLVMNLAYCLRLKHIGFVDVFIISIGFVLRVVIGGVGCQIWLSPWIILLTFLLALFLAFAKRRDDLVLESDLGVSARKSVKYYSIEFLNLILGVLSTVTIVCYIMYTMSPEVVERFGSEYLYATSIFVIGGILRYLQIIVVFKRSGNPTEVLIHDRFLQSMVVLWLISFVLLAK